MKTRVQVAVVAQPPFCSRVRCQRRSSQAGKKRETIRICADIRLHACNQGGNHRTLKRGQTALSHGTELNERPDVCSTDDADGDIMADRELKKIEVKTAYVINEMRSEDDAGDKHNDVQPRNARSTTR